MKAKTNNGSFDDSRGLGSDTSTVRFSSPISINEIVFAARREPVAKRVVVDVAYDVLAKGFKVQEESENRVPNGQDKSRRFWMNWTPKTGFGSRSF